MAAKKTTSKKTTSKKTTDCNLTDDQLKKLAAVRTTNPKHRAISVDAPAKDYYVNGGTAQVLAVACVIAKEGNVTQAAEIFNALHKMQPYDKEGQTYAKYGAKVQEAKKSHKAFDAALQLVKAQA